MATPGAGRARAVLGGLSRRWAVLVVLVLVWEYAARVANDFYFPPPSEIAGAARDAWLSGPPSRLWLGEQVLDDLLPSIGRLLFAWALASLVGVALGTALGRSRTALALVDPLLQFGRAVPPPVLIPVLGILVAPGTPVQLTVIVFGVLWPVLLNTVDGVRSVDPVMVATARAFRIPRWQWILGIVLPSAMPRIFAGLRVSLSLALILMVISELVAATNGFGYQLALAQRSFQLPAMWAGIVLLGVVGYLLNLVLLLVENRVLAWHQGARRRAGE